MSSQKLKDCPFCGSEPKIMLVANYRRTKIYCNSDCCTVKPSFVGYTKCSTISNWNTRASGWISVKDALPEKSGLYLACSTNPDRDYSGDDGVIKMLYSYNNEASPGDCRWQGLIISFYDNGITHWMPLPNIPQ